MKNFSTIVKVIFSFFFFFQLSNLFAQSCTLPETLGGEDKEICKEGSTTLGCDPIPGYCYKWTPEIGLDAPYSSMTNASPETTTLYTLHITDDNGNYIASDQVEVLVGEAIANAGADVEVCAGGSISLTVNATGTPAFSYQWSTGEESQTILVAPQETTTYSVTVTSETGCADLDEVVVSVFELPEFDILPENPMLCSGSSVILQVEPEIQQYNYLWQWGNSSISASSIVVDEIGTYSLTIIAPNGCTREIKKEVLDASNPQVIKEKFESEGFFATPITITDLNGKPSDAENSLTLINDYTDGQLLIEFVQNGSTISIAEQIEQFLLSTDYFPGAIQKGFVTKNESLCENPNLFNDIKDELLANDFGYWAHIWQQLPNEDSGFLFIGCNTPETSGITPSSEEHAAYIQNLLNQAPDKPLYGFPSENYRQARVVIDNLAYNFSFEDYANSLIAPDPCVPLQSEGILFAPTGIPMKLNPGTLVRFGAAEPVKSLADSRSLIGFTNNDGIFRGKYRHYLNNNTYEFLGYFNDYGDQVPYSYNDPLIDIAQPVEIILGTKELLDCPNAYYLIEKRDLVFISGFSINKTGAGNFVEDFSTVGYILNTLNYQCRAYICLPEISSGDFFLAFHTDNNHPQNEPQNANYGWVFHVQNENGEVSLIHAIYPYSSPNTPEFSIFNTVTGDWNSYDPPSQTLEDDLVVLSLFVSVMSDAGHVVLDGLGMFPLLGEPADIVNGIWYAAEGNYVDAGLCMASIVPIQDIGLKVGKYILRGGDILKSAEITHLTKKVWNSIQGGYEYPKMPLSGILDKLTEVYPNPNIGKPKAKKMLEWLANEADAEVLKKFVDNPELVNGWKFLEEIYGATQNNRLKDIKSIEKVTELLENQNFLTKISGTGNSADGVGALKKIIEKNSLAPCISCAAANSGNAHLKNIDEYLEDVRHFVETHGGHGGKAGAGEITGLMKTGHKYQIDAIAQTVRLLKEQNWNVERFEVKLSEVVDELESDAIVRQIADIKVYTPSGTKFIELKSYSDGTITSIPNKEQFINQLKTYLSTTIVSDISKLDYIFDKRKLVKGPGNSFAPFESIDEAIEFMKPKFQQIFQNQTYAEEIFFSMNNSLKTQLQIESAEDLIDLADDLNSILYNFVKVQ